eukprot:CAMPEP_0119317586 /NCGR_PEP_ID=MMETSP1333-20130426/43640_1 /TAXON_ID=418940 /ORGANISM="Scyphosphaera apsteinii, Strain RCC1455" /LENGTH=336 /DNA_ID=CAMNT_0007323565 /DNA_START=540 /DNA_END=1550 /DNA_ORIENTATION=-
MTLDEALRQKLAPCGTLQGLQHLDARTWLGVKAIFCAKRFKSYVSCGVDLSALQRLGERHEVFPRAEWSAVFRLPLVRHSSWHCEIAKCVGDDSGASNAEEAELDPTQSTSGFEVDELLLLAMPQVIPGWASPMAWFIQCRLHFAEALTTEGVAALAHYLQERQRTLRSSRPVIEVGAGDGRLAFMLNKTGLVEHGVVASDIDPAHAFGFPIEKMGWREAINFYRPKLVLCAWMTCGEDWTQGFQDAAVAEYVLIGDVAAGYSLARAHPPYLRTVLTQVSSELLCISDFNSKPVASMGSAVQGSCCAVAFRRSFTVSHSRKTYTFSRREQRDGVGL